MSRLRGSMVAIVTPMSGGVSPDAPIDWDAYARLVEFHLDAGTDAIVAVGTTGESATLGEAEHVEAIRRCVELVRGRVPVIAGTGANSTTEAIELTAAARRVGADACLLVTPYYNKPTQEGLYLHYKAVAEAVDIPQILYNVPGRTACDMLPETVGRLARLPNIIGVKEATGEVARVARRNARVRLRRLEVERVERRHAHAAMPRRERMRETRARQQGACERHDAIGTGPFDEHARISARNARRHEAGSRRAASRLPKCPRQSGALRVPVSSPSRLRCAQ